MRDDGDDLLLPDADFLERIAFGFEKVKIRAHNTTAGAQADAKAGTAQFRDRAVRLRAIARRLRAATQGESVTMVPLVPLLLGLENLIAESRHQDPERSVDVGQREGLRMAVDLAQSLKEERNG